MPAPDGFRVTQSVPGGEPVDLTRAITSAQWTSSIPGGFGSATISIPRALTQKERGLLGGITIEHEGRTLFDGRVEDAVLKWGKASVSTDLQAFGYQRLLTDCSTRRAWSMRNSLNPQASASAKGSSTAGVIALGTVFRYIFGRFDSANPQKFGFRMDTFVASLASLQSAQVGIALPTGITGSRLMCDVFGGGPDVNWKLNIHSTADGVTYTRHLEQTVGTLAVPFSVDVPLVNNASEIRITGTAVGIAGAPVALEIYNLRVLGTELRENAAGGFYGGTILRDAVAQCPGLFPGTIEDGSDFVIAEIHRVNRTSVLDVVNQIAPLYAREWGVWTGGRFDWITPDLKDPGWVVPLAKTTDGSIENSIDQLHRRTYVTYQDAADQQLKEASFDATGTRNPFVRLGQQKDGVVPAPTAMTSVTAPLLAAKISNDQGRWPDIKGSVTLLAGTMIQAANGSRQVPVFAVRAGDNITIPDLPVEDIYASGQDGQTVFHVTAVQAGTDGNVVLTLEGLTRRIDVLMARLSAFN